MWEDSRDEKLRDLWSRLTLLDEKEKDELCRLIHEVLLRFSSPEFRALRSRGYESAELVQDFILDKVLTGTDKRCDHTGALRHFFRNYLRDRLRHLKRREAYFDDSNEGLPPPAVEAEETQALKETLWEVNLSLEHVRTSAREWLRAQEEWVALYLALHHCPEGQQRLPLVRLAERYHISSYHYRAKKLGIVCTGGPKQFQQTLLGQWLTGLGLSLDVTDQAVLKSVLQILCLEALS